MTLQDVTKRTSEAVKHYAPEILTGASVLGLISTSYLASRAAFKSGMIYLEDAVTKSRFDEDEEAPDFMSKKELVKQTWKFFIPTVVVGAITAVSIVGSNRVSNSRNIAIMSAAAIGEQAYREYREKTEASLTKPKAQKILDEIGQDQVDEKKDDFDKIMLLAKDGDVACLERYTGRVFLSNAEKIHKAANDVARQCINDSYASHNDFMTLLGLSWTPAGEAVGWNNDNPIEIRLDAALHDGKPVYMVDYVKQPALGYSSPW